VGAVAISADGGYAVSGGDDGIVRASLPQPRRRAVRTSSRIRQTACTDTAAV